MLGLPRHLHFSTSRPQPQPQTAADLAKIIDVALRRANLLLERLSPTKYVAIRNDEWNEAFTATLIGGPAALKSLLELHDRETGQRSYQDGIQAALDAVKRIDMSRYGSNTSTSYREGRQDGIVVGLRDAEAAIRALGQEDRDGA